MPAARRIRAFRELNKVKGQRQPSSRLYTFPATRNRAHRPSGNDRVTGLAQQGSVGRRRIVPWRPRCRSAGGPRRATQLRPDTYLEWSNSEINTTGRNDVPAEPVRIEVRRWLRSGGLRDGGLRRWERCLRGRIYWRDLRSCRGSMIYPAFTFSLSFYAGRLDTFLCMEIHRSYEKASNGS